MKNIVMLAGAMVAGLSGTAAQAAVIVRAVAVTNAGFEDPVLADGRFHLGSFEGWYAGGGSAGAGAINPTAAMLPNVPEGSNVAFLNTFRLNGDVDGSLWQRLSESVVAGTAYQMKVDVGHRLDVANFSEWYAELTAGNDVIAIGTLADTDVAAGTFRTLTVNYTGSVERAGQQLGIRFRSVFDPAYADDVRQVNLDNVRLTATYDDAVVAVPEPATWAMMIVGFGMIGGTMRRRSTTVRFA